MFKRVSWLSLTPEPERELPRAVATLRAARSPDREGIAAERSRIERLILHGSERTWLTYLSDVGELIERSARSSDEHVIAARARAAIVVCNHHNLLLGLPSASGARVDAERERLATIVQSLPPTEYPEDIE